MNAERQAGESVAKALARLLAPAAGDMRPIHKARANVGTSLGNTEILADGAREAADELLQIAENAFKERLIQPGRLSKWDAWLWIRANFAPSSMPGNT